ncbi:MAG: hypothetical protein FJ086_01830 [Deltaproteobacteria bacterium]|nr:hypothetical protein [Deltaproteobacteria bacterium]
MRALPALLALYCLAPLSARAEVDWAEGVIRVTGSGPPDFRAQNPAQARLAAEKSAQEAALRAVLAHASSLPVQPGQPLEALFSAAPDRERLQQLARGFRVREKRYFSDNGLQVDVELPLAALAAAAIQGPPSAVINGKGEWEFTGLLVDARGLGAQPVLAPRLVDESGQVLYAPEWLSMDARGKVGVAAFFNGMERALKHPRVGDRPLVLKASAVKGAELVLSAASAAKLRKTRNGWLADGRVGVVVQ